MQNSAKEKPAAEEVRISPSSPLAKPEIAIAFEAISSATREHNQVLLAHADSDKPVNELAFNAGIAQLELSARSQAGVARKMIDAMAHLSAYEKGLFTPFDTMDRQIDGMDTWTNDNALKIRGYVQIIDQAIATYDSTIAYLERGEEPALLKYFNYHGVPADVTTEFIRVRKQADAEVGPSRRGMFQEQRLAMQSMRDALTSADPTKAESHQAMAKVHEKKAEDFEKAMLAGIRKQLGKPEKS